MWFPAISPMALLRTPNHHENFTYLEEEWLSGQGWAARTTLQLHFSNIPSVHNPWTSVVGLFSRTVESWYLSFLKNCFFCISVSMLILGEIIWKLEIGMWDCLPLVFWIECCLEKILLSIWFIMCIYGWAVECWGSTKVTGYLNLLSYLKCQNLELYLLAS